MADRGHMPGLSGVQERLVDGVARARAAWHADPVGFSFYVALALVFSVALLADLSHGYWWPHVTRDAHHLWASSLVVWFRHAAGLIGGVLTTFPRRTVDGVTNWLGLWAISLGALGTSCKFVFGSSGWRQHVQDKVLEVQEIEADRALKRIKYEDSGGH